MQVELREVHKYYNRHGSNEVHALKGISLAVDEGQCVCLQGPSGSGKSTLLSIIGCLYPPSAGRAVVCGKPLSRLPDHFLTRHRRQSIGFIFQRFNLIDSLSVLENITIPLLPLGLTPKQRLEKARPLLQRLDIDHRRRFRVDQISGGEMQRVAIGRALICDPPIILADEPTAHLDAKLSSRFMEMVELFKEKGKTIIIASHDPAITRHGSIDTLYSIGSGRILRGEQH
ncbi:MAG: ABC transporter ATP-binding protein [Desulfopila sp.]